MNYASVANAIGSNAGPALRMAGSKLGDFLLRPSGPLQRVARDTLAYTAVEQAVPRIFGAEAPAIEESLIRQAGGNIFAEGVTQGLGKAFPDTGTPIGRSDSQGNVRFRPSGIDPKLARGIGEFAGQAAGQRIADAVLPGKQEYPFINPGQGLEAERPGHPVSPTGAIPATHEPESAQVHRRDYHDLIFQKQLEAEADRQHYANRIALAHAQNQPRTITQRVEQDPMKMGLGALQEGYKTTRYG